VIIVANEQTLWGIHAGRDGEADGLFLRKKVIAIGWHEVGGISRIGNDREALKARYAETFPHAKAGAIPVHAAQLYRFASEMQVDDLIVYPSRIGRRVHIGRIKSAYRHDSSVSEKHPNVRNVE
jgi:restriction system protein